MLFANPRARREPYDDALRGVMSIAQGRESRRWLSGWRQLQAGCTPLWPLPRLAGQLSLGAISIKDESKRSPLGSFKALGAPIALLRLILRRWPDRGLVPADLLDGRHAAALKDFVVISATDGNHGRALAAAARSIGCRCVIVLHGQVSAEREQPIRELGAEIVRIQGNYDASVQEAARLARANGWCVVSDTSYEGYEEIPRDVMQGYAVIVDELLEQLPADTCPFSHVLLQGGVGGLAAGVVSHFCERYGARRPVFIVVEPEQADCLLQSARHGRASRATGSVDSVMAGLACGETSPLAWRFVQPAADFFMTVSDAQAEQAMRTLAAGAAGDVPVLSGESGAAGLAALVALAGDPALAAQVGLDAASRVLLLNTEGATAPGVYAAITGRSAASVLDAQAAWLAHDGIAEAALLARIEQHGRIGASAEGGVCRLALTDADRQGRDQLVAWMRELGLAVQVATGSATSSAPALDATTLRRS
jgi:beta-ureidopropionase / N-carbamoyl-L-amino-acid hydrolase